MTQTFNQEVMSFLSELETSFQQAEQFLKSSTHALNQTGDSAELAATIEHIQQAKQYVSKLRTELPSTLDQQEDEILTAVLDARSV
ncbi:MAG: hypothetical protein AB8B99_17925 [Phormidesmis sp.]